MSPPLLEVEALDVHYPLPGGRTLRAVRAMSFSIAPGETLGLVGESGCGKSSLARALTGLVPVAGGRALLLGQPLTGLPPRRMRPLRRHLQMIFQDPLAALDPRMTIGQAIAEPLQALRPDLDARGRRAEVLRLMRQVGLQPEWINRYPHEFSGGQCQRVGIARALAPEPQLLVCDEPVSALDVSVQAQIVNLLLDLREANSLAMLFIAHDLAVVKQLSHRVLVMYLGRTMELAPTETLFADPRHPYTRALLDAVPRPHPRLERNRPRLTLSGDLPSPLDPPSGCPFHTRCPVAEPQCSRQTPLLRQVAPGHQVACHLAGRMG